MDEKTEKWFDKDWSGGNWYKVKEGDNEVLFQDDGRLGQSKYGPQVVFSVESKGESFSWGTTCGVLLSELKRYMKEQGTLVTHVFKFRKETVKGRGTYDVFEWD